MKNRGFLSGLSGLLGSSPAIEGVNDGRSLPGLIERDPLEDMSAGRRPAIPLLTGTTRDETKRAVDGTKNNYYLEVIA